MAAAGRPDEATKWTIHSERVVDDTRRGRLSIVGVELPDGVTFEQYVLACPPPQQSPSSTRAGC